MAAPLNSTASSLSANSASPATQIASLTAELQQREQLIEVLTERLEEAAEQLDRFHRSGADRALRAGGGGGGSMSSEVLDRLGGMADGLEMVANDWQDLQAGALLHRLDHRIEKLIELLDGGSSGVSGTQTASGAFTEAVPQHGTAEPSVTAGTAESKPAVPAVEEEEPPLELPPAPAEVAEGETDAARLLAAVREREEYISYLIRELHRRRPRQPLDWTALQSCPEQLTAALKTLEQRLQSELQREELNLSLERARMARERAELDRVRSRLEKEIRTLGRGAGDAAPAADKAPAEAGGGFRLFGRKR